MNSTMVSIPSSGSGSQDWCDGNIGMHGPSYVGNVQWQAAAMGSRYLKTIVPRVIGDNLHESPQYQGGAFQLGWTALWSFLMDGRSGQSLDIYDWTQVFHTLPICDLPTLCPARTSPSTGNGAITRIMTTTGSAWRSRNATGISASP